MNVQKSRETKRGYWDGTVECTEVGTQRRKEGRDQLSQLSPPNQRRTRGEEGGRIKEKKKKEEKEKYERSINAAGLILACTQPIAITCRK